MTRRVPVPVIVPAAAVVLTLVALLLSPELSTGKLTQFSWFNIFQQLAWLAPLTLAFGLAMMAGEFDLSAAGVAAFGGMVALKTGNDSAYVGALVAVAAGITVGLLQGVLLARLQISSVPVTLGTYIALIGATQWISGDKVLSYPDTAVPSWFGQQSLLGVLSPGMLITLATFAVIGVVMTVTSFGRHARAIGSDRRASRVVGVRVDLVLVSLFAMSGALAALSGIILTYTNGSANPEADIEPLILGVVGALVGGATLRGGYGGVVGLLAGATAVCFLQAVFVITALDDWVSQLVFAALLLSVAALDAPDLGIALGRLRRRLGSRATPPDTSQPSTKTGAVT